MSSFYLMRKDTPVCEFDVRNVSDNRVAVEMTSVFDEKRMPLEMQFEPNIAHYLVGRLAPLIYGGLGYSVLRNGKPLAGDLDNVIDYTGGFSLIDDFWLVRKGDDSKNWEKNNLFTNNISEEISNIAFS
ncbi:MAG: hypothetical protein FWH33_01265, partial [Oscillospiraceae bacterium]|nr:hypothetical protein [Oscillospiraceae bacterium]